MDDHNDHPCGWLKHGGDLLFLPGCMGGAVRGPEGCTCNLSDPPIPRTAQTLLDELARAIERLHHKDPHHQHLVPGMRYAHRVLCRAAREHADARDLWGEGASEGGEPAWTPTTNK